MLIYVPMLWYLIVPCSTSKVPTIRNEENVLARFFAGSSNFYFTLMKQLRIGDIQYINFETEPFRCFTFLHFFTFANSY